MTLEGWIFMVGLRVFDVGALIVWLVWFFRLRDDDSDDGDDFRGGADEPEDPGPPGGKPGLRIRSPTHCPGPCAGATIWPVRPPPRAAAAPRRPAARPGAGARQASLSGSSSWFS